VGEIELNLFDISDSNLLAPAHGRQQSKADDPKKTRASTDKFDFRNKLKRQVQSMKPPSAAPNRRDRQPGNTGTSNYEHTNAPIEDEEARTISANVKITKDRKAIESMLNKMTESGEEHRIWELYGKADKLKGQYDPAAVASHLAPSVEKTDKWTYQQLAESAPLMHFVERTTETIRAFMEKKLERSTMTHEFEWVVVVDNSGSMSPVANEIAETLVVLIEVLRKLEHKFGVAIFGGDKSQHVLKYLDAENSPDNKASQYQFSRKIGEQILASLTFDEGSKLHSGVNQIASTFFKGRDIKDEKANCTHRNMIVITDGLSQELENMETSCAGGDLGSNYCLKLAVMHIGPAEARDNIEQLSKTKSILRNLSNNTFEFATRGDDQMPKQIGKLLFTSVTVSLDNEDSTHDQLDTAQRKLLHAFTKESAREGQTTRLFPIGEKVGDTDLQKILEEKGAGARQSTWYQVSQRGRPVPNADLALAPETPERIKFFEKEWEAMGHGLSAYLQDIQHFQAFKVREAEQSWITAVMKLRQMKYYIDMVSVFEEAVMPVNKYTRRKADMRGSQLYLPGLIKAVITDFNYKKFFSTRTAGGRREYSVVLAVDVSLSMHGHLEECAVETLLLLVTTLIELQIDTFSIVLFGERVRVIKRQDQPWDAPTIFALLANLRFDNELGSCDADAVRCAEQLLNECPGRAPKKVFVITD
jgi:hypothetical protein